MELLERLTSPGPKRILALDGGGIRGVVTLGMLERIESTLRERHGDPAMRLCDYFDLIGGTSSGALIASGLALGLTVADLREIYLELAGLAFGRRRWQFWKSKFDARPLELQLKRLLGDRTLCDEDFRTGLCIITKRADTGSTWRLFNHPNGHYFNDNRDILVRKVVRASIAAPFFFSPTEFEVKEGQIGAFVDGGISMANNPGLELFLVATLKGFPFRWPTGADQLMLVSVGTGSWSNRESSSAVLGGNVMKGLRRSVSMLMSDTDWHGQTILQAMSDSPTPWKVDREIGDLSDDMISGTPALHYLRYNVLMESEDLEALGLKEQAGRLNRLRDAFAAGERNVLAEIGATAGRQRVKAEHFPDGFDVAARGAVSRVANPVLTPERMLATRGIADAAVRNLQITQFYHEAADEMARFIGSRDVTWFAFGTRASKTVGRIIRYELLPGWIRRPLMGGRFGRLASPVAGFVLAERNLMAQGNVLVFEELGPVACAFLDRFGGGRADPAGLDEFLAGLRPGASPEGGQDLVKAAFRAWYEAAHEAEPSRKAQLVLLGNVSAVYHEQQRLQPLLERSLEVPVLDTACQRAARVPVAGWGVRRLRPLGMLARAGWQRFATHTTAFAAYDLPEMALGLGVDVRGYAPGIDFPPALRELTEPRLCELLDSLGAPKQSTDGSASANWADLPERMRYIATVFRSRQQDLGLLAPPFSRRQVETFEAGTLPKGPL